MPEPEPEPQPKTNAVALVFERDGKALTSSRDVAAMFGKEHFNILRDIGHIIHEVGALNFEASSYRTAQNKEAPCYEMDSDGFISYWRYVWPFCGLVRKVSLKLMTPVSRQITAIACVTLK
jgi:hypothetical protein